MGFRKSRDTMRSARSGANNNARPASTQRGYAGSYSESKPHQVLSKTSSASGYKPVDSRQGFASSQDNVNSGFVPAASHMGGGNATNNFSRKNPRYQAKNGLGTGAKIAIGFVCVFLLCAIGAGIAAAQYISSINNNLHKGKTVEEQMVISDLLAPPKKITEPFYMILIGSDARADGSVGGQRSDTNILCRVDPSANQVTMISIPRDTKIEIEGYGTNKFNAAYAFEGVAGVLREANKLCGVEISHYAEINFESLIQLVDVVGGVTVNVPELIDDPNAATFAINPGEQVLDGEHALAFARSRAYMDGDFTRTSNQRLLIEALIEKILGLPPAELPGVIMEASKCVSTDMSVKDIINLATQFKNEGDLTIYSAMVPSTTAMIGEVSYVLCDYGSLGAMMEIVEAGGDPNTIVTNGSAIGSYLSDTPYGGAQGPSSNTDTAASADGSASIG